MSVLQHFNSNICEGRVCICEIASSQNLALYGKRAAQRIILAPPICIYQKSACEQTESNFSLLVRVRASCEKIPSIAI